MLWRSDVPHAQYRRPGRAWSPFRRCLHAHQPLLSRAGGAEGDKGAEAARAAVEMARLAPRLAEPPGGDAA